MAFSLTENIDNLYTTTWQNMKDSLQDQIYNSTPFWFWMKDNKRLEAVEGGRFMAEPLIFAKSSNVKFIGKGSTVRLGDKEFLTEAIYEWRYLADSLVRFGTDDQKKRGKNQIISLMKAKIENAKNSLTDRIEEVLFGADTQGAIDDTLPFHGLQKIIPDDPTAAGTFGGIDQVVNTWWRDQTLNATGKSFTLVGDKLMREILNDCSNNKRQERPDLILSGEKPYRLYEENLTTMHIVDNSRLADAGFETIRFKGIDMVWSPSCADTRMYLPNTRYLKFKYDPQMNFDMTSWKEIPDQVNDRAAQIVLAGNLCTGRRRVHGVIHTIDTD